MMYDQSIEVYGTVCFLRSLASELKTDLKRGIFRLSGRKPDI